MPLTRGQLWRSARDRLASAGIETAALDARVLLAHCLGLDRTQLIASEAAPVDDADMAAYQALVVRRLAREPVARIMGRQEFYGLYFGLNEATLIPRPETEMLVDFGIARLKGREGATILDLGTGTGCIVLSLLANVSGAKGVGVDLSARALEQARENAVALGLDGRFERWRKLVCPVAGRRFDLIVANPYIASETVKGLRPRYMIRRWRSMAGRMDWSLSVIAAGVADHLNPGSVLAIEIGFDQGNGVSRLLEDAGLSGVGLKRTLGHDKWWWPRCRVYRDVRQFGGLGIFFGISGR